MTNLLIDPLSIVLIILPIVMVIGILIYTARQDKNKDTWNSDEFDEMSKQWDKEDGIDKEDTK